MNVSYFENGVLRPQSDVVTEHLTGCARCQELQTKPPVANLNPLGMGVCSDLLAIFQWYADYEGEVNNVVNHDEYGNYAG